MVTIPQTAAQSSTVAARSKNINRRARLWGNTIVSRALCRFLGCWGEELINSSVKLLGGNSEWNKRLDKYIINRI